MILERLGKYQEALDVIRGKLGGNLEFSFFILFSFWSFLATLTAYVSSQAWDCTCATDVTGATVVATLHS